MPTEKKLAALFEYQKYEGNAALQGVIDSVRARYASAASRELSMEEMDVVYAAGQQVTREKLAAMIRHISGGNDHERA